MLNEELKLVLENALNFAKDRRCEYFTVEHVFLKLLENKTIKKILNNLNLNLKEISIELEKFIDETVPTVSKDNKEYKEPVETVTLINIMKRLLGYALSNNERKAGTENMLAEIIKIKETFSSILLRRNGISKIKILEEIVDSDENQNYNIEYSGDYEDDLLEEDDSYKKDFLEDNAQELVQLAKDKKLDPVFSRDDEVYRLIEILSRRKKNNPILVGEPGVGKTAIVQGLAREIAFNKVPHSLKDAKIYSLEVSSLLSGTKYRGEFEKKFKDIIKEITEIPNAILFIDEIHTIVGAGSTGGGSIDASNILKPYLSSGEMKCIGATTYAEYRNEFAKDKALARRFSKIDVNEPSINEAIKILSELKKYYEKFHNVKYSPGAIEQAVKMSKKYIQDRFLPDSAIDIIDEAGANKKIANEEKKIKKPTVTQKDVELIVGKIAHIPAQTASTSELTLLKNLEKNMKQKVFGQDKAMQTVIKSIKRNKAGLGLSNKPIGSFLFTGPTGVGKTEVAKQLAKQLGVNFERFDMSEYMESHTVSRLIGAPAGYVGFDQGGLLTEAIRKHPYSVLLLDEIEKAHPDLMSILLQVMDNARLTDNSGNKADFQNVILIMTSNLGVSEPNIMGFTKDETLKEHKAINKFFAPEFRNRLDSIVSFEALDIDIVENIVVKFIQELEDSLKDKKIKITLTSTAKKQLAILGYDKAMGARPLQRVISKTIKDELTDQILFGELKKGGEVFVDYKDEDFTFIYKKGLK